jgi:AraC family transcriptional regulator
LLYGARVGQVLAIIAIDVRQAVAERAARGGPAQVTPRPVAEGDGWAVHDVLCTSGPQDRPFEEQHGSVAVAIVVAGSFQYWSRSSRELMTPGSLLLGSAGQSFECRHDHGAGDRCLSFRYAPDYFECVAADAGASSHACFRTLRLPPLKVLSPIVARACAGLAGSGLGIEAAAWDEISVELAAHAVQLATNGSSASARTPPGAEARVARTVRTIERHLDAPLDLDGLARQAGLSPYHFLRTFQRVTGVTPHQFVLRARLREAAVRLTTERRNVLDIALDCGFGDVSNFNRAFRTEFGVNPRRYLCP